MPDLLAAPQQVESIDGYDVLAAVLLDQPSLDLVDLRSHRTAERRATDVVDVEPDNRSGFWRRTAGGLQCVAARKQNDDSRNAAASDRPDHYRYHPYPLFAATEPGALPAPNPAP